MDTRYALAPRIAAARDELRERRAARAAHRALKQGLPKFSTPAELTEIRAILARHDGPDVAEMREIINSRHIA
ncbi:MAG: hypothetical protein QOG98_2063 [Pseudonocardiales bacterium]|jgi:hypothetical protein|nr:hypothetical protein [Pseudonocardiales bacterium]